MNTRMTLYKLLYQFQQQSKHGFNFSYYASYGYHRHEIIFYWPHCEYRLQFAVSDIDLLIDPEKALKPYVDKAFEHEKYLDSPLIKALE